MLAAYPAGWLSDRFGRKILLTISLLLQMVTPIGLAFTKSLALDLVFGFIYGIGNVMFNAVSFAVLNDILPTLKVENEGKEQIDEREKNENNAFIMGVFNVAQLGIVTY